MGGRGEEGREKQKEKSPHTESHPMWPASLLEPQQALCNRQGSRLAGPQQIGAHKFHSSSAQHPTRTPCLDLHRSRPDRIECEMNARHKHKPIVTVAKHTYAQLVAQLLNQAC